jgi:hypothetical protein
MINSIVEQSDVYVTIADTLLIDTKSRIDASASVVAANNAKTGNAVGAGHGGNGAGPRNVTALDLGYGNAVTPGAGRAGGEHASNGTTDVRGGFGGGVVHVLGEPRAVLTINGAIAANGEKGQFGKQKVCCDLVCFVCE